MIDLIAPVAISSLQESSTTTFALNCSSFGSPPTNVTWRKDGETLTVNDTFATIQYLRDGVAARFDNILTISLQPSEVIGTYICSIDNLVSVPVEQTLTLQGL